MKKFCILSIVLIFSALMLYQAMPAVGCLANMYYTAISVTNTHACPASAAVNDGTAARVEQEVKKSEEKPSDLKANTGEKRIVVKANNIPEKGSPLNLALWLTGFPKGSYVTSAEIYEQRKSQGWGNTAINLEIRSLVDNGILRPVEGQRGVYEKMVSMTSAQVAAAHHLTIPIVK